MKLETKKFRIFTDKTGSLIPFYKNEFRNESGTEWQKPETLVKLCKKP